jgi:hypothetical protein
VTTSSSSRFPPPEDPRKALENANVARYFHHYISHLAPWYDLSDMSLEFSTKIPEYALDSPLIFSAVLALSAIHVANTITPSARAAAEFYHGCCIRQLISLSDDDLPGLAGIALATTCLLRSYEILDGKYTAISKRNLSHNPIQERKTRIGISMGHIPWPRSNYCISTDLMTAYPLLGSGIIYEKISLSACLINVH